jgi:queuine/archaeosine tRNA-ribosyltransferase
MNSIEAEKQQIEENDDVVRHEKELVNHEITPKDRMENQIRLAVELMKELDQEVDLESTMGRNEIMLEWTNSEGKESYSSIYRKMEKDSAITDHPRIQGNIFNITGADVKYYAEHNRFPEE